MKKSVIFLIIFLLLVSLPLSAANTFMEENYAAVISEVRAGYPELANTTIQIVFKPLKGMSMAARPHPSFLFRSRENHLYRVIVNTNYAPDALIMQNYTQRGLVGITAHEFGHILDYSQMNDVQILWFGIKYALSKNFKREVEHYTDEEAIAHGFGEELLEAVNSLFTATSYWEHKAGIYYTPDELESLIIDK